MTRDEAIETVISKSGGYACERRMAACLVDTWAAVGMLKLDEPQSVNERAWEVLRDFTPHATVIDRLHAAGLKIVEK